MELAVEGDPDSRPLVLGDGRGPDGTGPLIAGYVGVPASGGAPVLLRPPAEEPSLLYRFDRAAHFPFRVPEPVGAPDAVDAPPQPLQHLLPQAVPVARRTRAVVGGAVALDAEQVAPRALGVDHGQVDKEPGAPHLGLDPVALLLQGAQHRLLEGRVGLAPRGDGYVE